MFFLLLFVSNQSNAIRRTVSVFVFVSPAFVSKRMGCVRRCQSVWSGATAPETNSKRKCVTNDDFGVHTSTTCVQKVMSYQIHLHLDVSVNTIFCHHKNIFTQGSQSFRRRYILYGDFPLFRQLLLYRC